MGSSGFAWLRRVGAFNAALLITLVLLLPTFYLTLSGSLGFVADDYWHHLAFEGRSYPGGPVPGNLFRFVSGDREVTRAAMQLGVLPWYSDLDLKIAFFRPLSGLLHHLDHLLFGDRVLLTRLHNLVWYVALLFVCSRIVRRVLSARVATLALLVFACAAAHWQPIVWPAARNALVSATFACTAVLAYLRFRESGATRWLALASLCYSLGILAGESAFGILPYLAAYEFTKGTGRARVRLLALTPFALLSAGALALIVLLGYGVQRSAAYLSPLAEPGQFLAELPVRLSCMLSFSYLGLPADLWFLEPRFRLPSAALGAAATVWMLASFRLVWRALEPSERDVVVWMGLAALGAMVPQAAGLLGSRSLTLPSLGTSVVVALLLAKTIELWKSAHAARFERTFACVSAGLLCVIHLFLAPLSWVTNALFYGDAMDKVARSADGVNLAQSRGQKAVLLQVSDAFVFRYFPFERRAQHKPVPDTWHSLSQANHDHLVHRTGPQSFELEILGGEMFESPMETLSRARGTQFRAGDQFQLDDFSVRILEAGAIGPRKIAVQFRRPLEDSLWLFLVWKEGRLARFHFPEIGGSVRLPFSPGPTAVVR